MTLNDSNNTTNNVQSFEHHICVIARTYNGQDLRTFNSFLYSMDSQSIELNKMSSYNKRGPYKHLSGHLIDWDLFIVNANGGNITNVQQEAIINTNSSHIHWVYVPLNQFDLLIQQNLKPQGYVSTDFMLKTLLNWDDKIVDINFCNYFYLQMQIIYIIKIIL